MEWLKVLPPLVAIIIVIWKKEVITALLLAIFVSEWILWDGDGIIAFYQGILQTVERIVAVFGNPGNTRVLLFSLLIGALLAMMRKSGGVAALVESLIKKGFTKTPRQVSLLTSITGVVVFIESNLSVLTAGILSRGLFDKFGLSRAKLAYIIDSTSAPVCILILLNAWGAYVLALLNQYQFSQSATSILWGTIPYNFYALVTLAIVFYSSWSGKYFGPLAKSKVIHEDISDKEKKQVGSHPSFMIVPILILIGGMIAFMIWTGGGDIAQGNGSKSILYATVFACIILYIMMVGRLNFSNKKIINIGFEGISDLLPLVTILLLSIALGSSLKALGTGLYISQIVGSFLPLILIAPMIFLVGAIISFSTGTSWGTFAILIPIAAPIIQMMHLPPSLIIAAVLGGGVFGDHCSPISDTTAVSAIASGCDLLEHVRTQLPYAIFTGIFSFFLYLIASMIII